MKAPTTFLLILWLAVAPSLAAEPQASDPQRIEKDLQALPWEQFKAVVSAVPKMKAEVDRYGPMGWQYVKTHYRTYAWRRNIEKLDPAQRRRLQELIRTVRGAPPARMTRSQSKDSV